MKRVLLTSLLGISSLAYGAMPQAALPPDSEYVVLDENGHFVLNGERQRFWAAIGKISIWPHFQPGDSEEVRRQKVENSRRGTDALLQRAQDLGFNAFRLWTAVAGSENYEIGDGSDADVVDYFLTQARQRGFRIWISSMNRIGDITPDDVDIIDDPATADEWRKAIAEFPNGRISLRGSIAKYWDPRIEAKKIERMKAVATHLNKHNGLRWSDDPVFSVWEISNEEWWMRKMVGGQWQREPQWLRNQLLARWNTWLQEKYGSDEKLKAAWEGLLPGESLAQGSVLFAPMAGITQTTVSINDANIHALEAVQALKQEYSREDFARQRGADVLEFLVGLQVAHKRRVEEQVKTWGRSTALSPVLYDTGIGYEIQSQYMHQNADAVSHNAYVNGFGPAFVEPDLSKFTKPREKKYEQLSAERLAANDGHWVNWLRKPPGIAQGVPWLEHNRVEGKPFLVYETQIQQPAKYRADFPLRLAALASIQDWDWICWHYWAPPDDIAQVERPFDRAMDITTGTHPQGYHYTFDEVQTAMMRAAGHLWRSGGFKPAPNPTKFIYGRKSLFDPESMVYAGSYGETGLDMLQTTYEYGVRIFIDPTRDDDEVIGPVVRFEDRNTHNPYRPTNQILFDWKKGYLSKDAPTGVAWTGMLAHYGEQVTFNHGVTLRNVVINNPEGIFQPVREDEKYIAFSLYATDGQPLENAKSASLSLVSTSFNTGFRLGDTVVNPYRPPQGTVGGRFPVLVARVGATIEAPALDGMSYTLRDWHMKEIGRGRVENGVFTLSSEQPVFVVEFERP